MSWVVADQGTVTGTSGATLVCTIPTTIAVGSLVVVAAAQNAAVLGSTAIADSQSNTYTLITDVFPSGGTNFEALYYSVLTTALVGGTDTITLTKTTSGTAAALSVLSATGNSSTPLDTSVTATTSGSAGIGTLTSGTPSVAGELFVAFVGAADAFDSLASDTTNSWTTPPFALQITVAPHSVGAYQVNAGTGTKIYAPTTMYAGFWGIIIAGFKPGTTNATGTVAMAFAKPKIAATAQEGDAHGTVSMTFAKPAIAATAQEGDAHGTVSMTFAKPKIAATAQEGDAHGTVSMAFAKAKIAAAGYNPIHGTVTMTFAKPAITIAGIEGDVTGAVTMAFAKPVLTVHGTEGAILATVHMAFAGPVITASSTEGDVTGTVTMTFAKPHITAAGYNPITGTVTMTFAKPLLAVINTLHVTGTVTLTFAKAKIDAGNLTHGTVTLTFTHPKFASLGSQLAASGNPSYYSWWFLGP
jgi:hypothetical protein